MSERLLISLALFFAFALLGWVAVTAEAPAHSFYAGECCDDRDCRPAAKGGVTPVKGGWHVALTGEIIPYSDKRIRHSPDGQFHVCKLRTSDKLLCLYTPDMGS